MASNVTIEQENPYKKISIKTTPLMLLKSIVVQTCEKWNIPDPDAYTLKLKKTSLDLSLSVRFANLAPGAKLTLVRSSPSDSSGRGNGTVLIALQGEDTPRLTHTFPITISLWGILLHFETTQGFNFTRRTGIPTGTRTGIAKALKEVTSKPVYMIPVCIFMNREYGTISELKNTTLKSAGLEYGNGIIRCLFRFSDKQIEHFLPEIESSPPSTIVSQQQPLSSSSAQVQPSKTTSATTPLPRPGPAPSSNTNERNLSQATDEKRLPTPPISNVSTMPTEASQTVSSVPEPLPSPLNTAKLDEKPVFEKNIQYFKPPPANAPIRNIVLPDSFFSLSVTEMKLLLSSHQSTLSKLENAPLMTRAMREREEQLKRQKYPKTMIRVRFPDHTTLQVTFYSGDTVDSLYETVEQCIAQRENCSFVLYVTPPHRNLPRGSSTFWDEKLAPASLVYFNWSDGNIQGPFLNVPVEAMSEFPVPQEEEVASTLPAETEGQQETEMEVDYRPASQQPRIGSSSTEATKKLPKWFKMK